MTASPTNPLLEKLASARELPTIPAVLVPLLRYMEQPSDTLDIQQLVKLISQDKSLAARCLQMANSPLFGCSHEVETIQSAVVALGLNRIQEIAVSCSLLRLLPAVSFGVSPSVFWAHSLACAMVAREFASRIGFSDPAKAYAAGLLHDVGIVALLWVSPHVSAALSNMEARGGFLCMKPKRKLWGSTTANAARSLQRAGTFRRTLSRPLPATILLPKPLATRGSPVLFPSVICSAGWAVSDTATPKTSRPTSPRSPASRFWRHIIVRCIRLIWHASPLKPRACWKKFARSLHACMELPNGPDNIQFSSYPRSDRRR